MQSGACCRHNKRYFDANAVLHEQRGDGLVEFGLTFLARMAIAAIIKSAISFATTLSATKDMKPDQRDRVWKQYVRHLVSRENLITDPIKGAVMSTIFAQMPWATGKLADGLKATTNAVPGVVNEALDFGSLVPAKIF